MNEMHRIVLHVPNALDAWLHEREEMPPEAIDDDVRRDYLVLVLARVFEHLAPAVAEGLRDMNSDLMHHGLVDNPRHES